VLEGERSSAQMREKPAKEQECTNTRYATTTLEGEITFLMPWDFPHYPLQVQCSIIAGEGSLQ
jgi:hypothetical protein